MEAKAHILFNKARAFAEVMIPILCLLGCMYRALGYLSGELADYIAFSPCKVRDRRYGLFPDDNCIS